MDQRRRTHNEKNALSCVFDTRFTFEFKNKTKEDINAANIQFDVRNYNVITSYRLIGSYVDDLANIYNKKDKEDSKLYRRWVCLMDSEDGKDSGIQGYLKVSVEIVCPGKTLPIHDVDKEIKEEFDSNDITLALPRSMPFREWKYLVVNVYKCEYLPVMKSKVPGTVLVGKDNSSEGTTAFCQLLHGSSKALKSKPLLCKIDESDPSTCHREFRYQLWYPICIPASSEVITFSVWSKSRIGSNNLIANVVESISNIESNIESNRIKWYNLYGCPETSKEQSLVGSVGKAIKGTLTSATSKLLHSTDHRKRYNDFPSIAPAWKGRVLLSFSVKSEEDVTEPLNNLYYAHKPFPVDSLSDNVTIETIDLCLKVQIFMASQIKIQKGKKYKFKVSIGEIKIFGKEADTYGNQLCKWKWDEGKIDMEVKLPCFNEDLRQIPDVFIYLLEDDTPIFFKRIAPYKEVKSKEVKLLGFDDKPQWVHLNVNKAAYQLEEGYGHGKLLVRIGLDKKDVSNIKNWYKDDSNNSKSTNNKKSLPPPPPLYDVRICIYQAEYLKQVDYNNDKADPYVKVSFNGREKKTSVFRYSVHPAWYEVLLFDRVPLSEEENFIYNDLITCSLYDHNDYRSHRYLGSVTLSLDKDLPLDKERQTVVSDPSESPIPEEGDWHDIKRGEGRILIKVVLVKHTSSTQDPPSIVPYTKSAVIKIFALGLRELPSTTINPFLEVKIQSFISPNPKFGSRNKASDAKRVYDIEDGRNSNRIPDDSDDISAKKTYTLEVLPVKTSKSKKPKPTNPNYLSELIIHAQLPEEQIFARPLILEVRDAGVGVKGRDISTGTGIVGRGVIDLKKRFPWVECNKSASYESDLSYEDPPLFFKNQEWAVGRKFLKGSVENSIKRSDFESFDIERLSFGVFKKSVQVVGKFKGFVRVFENSASGPIMGKDVQRKVKKENAKYTVRLYILDAINLQAMDYDWINMQPKSSDPYLKVKLGDSLVLNDSKNFVSSATEVDFHKVIEFDCQLPGIANVLIEVWDKDNFSRDDLIGQTVIDLEDRFFNENWDALGKEEGKKAGKLWDRKPVERRELYHNQSSQGQLRCWLDIMKIEEASSIPPDDIAIPPNEAFEVRVVIWGTKDVRSQDTLGGIGIGSDLYVKCWPEGCKPQSTDTHWRCQDGNLVPFNSNFFFL